MEDGQERAVFLRRSIAALLEKQIRCGDMRKLDTLNDHSLDGSGDASAVQREGMNDMKKRRLSF